MKRRYRKPLPMIGLFLVIGLVCMAATEAYTRTSADTVLTTRDSKDRRTPLISFYVNEAVKMTAFTETSSRGNIKRTANSDIAPVFQKEWNKVAAQIPREKLSALERPVLQSIHVIKQALWNLRTDCIVGNMAPPKFKDLENFRLIVQAGLTTIQNDCLRAVSMYPSPVERLNIETRAHNAYKNFAGAANEEYNLMALDELEKSYLSFLYLAITEPYDKTKKEYYFIVGLVGLKLWSFNKDDAAMLPLLALSAEDVSSSEGMSAWLLLKDHVQFSNSGSAGERVPIYWNAVLHTTGRK